MTDCRVPAAEDGNFRLGMAMLEYMATIDACAKSPTIGQVALLTGRAGFRKVWQAGPMFRLARAGMVTFVPGKGKARLWRLTRKGRLHVKKLQGLATPLKQGWKAGASATLQRVHTKDLKANKRQLKPR